MADLSGGLVRDIEARSADPLERLADATRTSLAVGQTLDDLVGRFVEEARAAGCSWTQVGDALGVSKQAAQQRLPARPGDGWPPDFREDAQRSLADAGEHARRLGHPYLGTEHVLLALAEQPDSLAGRLLAELAVTPQAVEAAIDRLCGRSAAVAGAIGVSPRLKRALDAARRQGRSLGHRCPGAEHLLLSLASDPAAASTRILTGAGVDQKQISETLAPLLGPDADELSGRLARPRRRLLRRR